MSWVPQHQEIVAAQRQHFAGGVTQDAEEPPGCDPLDHTNASTGCPSDSGPDVARLHVMEALGVLMMQAGGVRQMNSTLRNKGSVHIKTK